MIEYPTAREAKAVRRAFIENGAEPVAVHAVCRGAWDFSRPLSPRYVSSGGWALETIQDNGFRMTDREGSGPYRGSLSDEVAGF